MRVLVVALAERRESVLRAAARVCKVIVSRWEWIASLNREPSELMSECRSEFTI